MIANGGTSTISGNVELSGDISNNGSINGGSSTIIFNGNTEQTIYGSGTFLFDNFILNKPSTELIIATPISINGTLTMTEGNISNSNNVITIGTTSSSPGSISHNSGIITGKLRRYFSNGNVSTFFPVGNSSELRDITIDIQGSPGTNQYLTAQFVNGCPQDQSGDLTTGLPINASDGQLIENYKNDGHWEIDPTDSDYESQINTKTYTVYFHVNNFSDVNDYTQMRVIKCSGSNTPAENHVIWSSITHESSIGTNSDFIVSATSSGFSFFSIGGDDNGALPVVLSSFNGNCNDNSVNIAWETESEYNSSHFILEYSRDGEEWSIINNQSAALNSTEHISYEYNHLNSHSGDNYYRLSQVDIDGATVTYDIINVNCEDLATSYFNIYPNPSNGNIHLILNDKKIIGEAYIRVIDTKGNIILKKPIEVKNGINVYILDEKIASGIYYINILNGDKSTMIVKHSIL